jgi:hypothetical protein
MGGYGGRFAQWVRSDNPLPYNSFGNGYVNTNIM